MLKRAVQFVRGKLTHPNLNLEFNTYQGHANRRLLTTPLGRDLDFNGFLAKNFRADKVFEVRNAAEFRSLKAAVDSIGSNPGVIFLPANTTFIEDTLIQCANDLTIVGSGWTSVVQADSTLTSSSLFDVQDINRVQFLNFKIDGNSATTSAVPCIDATSTSGTDFRMDGVWLTDWGNSSTGISTLRHGLKIHGMHNARITNCKFGRCEGSAIFMGAIGSESADFTQYVAYNQIDQAQQHGAYIHCGYNVKFVHNQISRSDFSGIFIDAPSSGTQRNTDISYNQIHQAGLTTGTTYDISGIHGDLTGGTINNLRIFGNQIYDVDSGGYSAGAGGGNGIRIQLGTSSATIDNLIISGNELFDMQEFGIYVIEGSASVTCRNVVVDNNTITDFGQRLAVYDAISVLESSGTIENVGIRGNMCGNSSQNYVRGVNMTAGSNSSPQGIISNNQFHGTITIGPIVTANCEQMTVGYNAVSAPDSVFS